MENKDPHSDNNGENSIVKDSSSNDGSKDVPNSKINRLVKYFKHTDQRSTLLVISIIAVLILIIGLSYAALHKKSVRSDNQLNATQNNTITPTTSISPAEQARVNQGLPPNQSSSSVKIDYVTIDNNLPYDNSSDSLSESNGHYIFHEAINSFGGAYLGKIIYDGTTVYQDPNTTATVTFTGAEIDGQVVLSNNGLHYGYIIRQNNSEEIFIDNKPVKTIPGSSALLAISNDGNNYEYTQANANIGGTEIVNAQGKTIPVSANSDCSSLALTCSIDFDGDLANYLTYTGSDYIYDGHKVANNTDVYGSMGISGNGGHYYINANDELYWYTISSSKLNPTYQPGGCGEDGPAFCADKYLVNGTDYIKGTSEIILDGETVYETSPATVSSSENQWGNPSNKSSSPNTNDNNVLDSSPGPNYIGLSDTGVNSGGDYYFLQNPDNPSFVIDGKYIYNLKKTILGSGSFTIDYCAINDGDDHYVVTGGPNNGNSTYADIDGKVSELSGNNIRNTELDGNTLYVYSLADSGS